MSLGFESAPATRIIVYSVFTLTALLNDKNVGLELSEVFKGQVWRLLTSHLVFNNMGQAFFGLIALYNLRQFERQLGAKKFAAFLVISYIISLFSQILVLFLVNTVGGQHFVFDNGPYFLIFALLSLFYSHVPRLHPRKFLLGLVFSEKSWIYLITLQLLFSNGLSSMSSGVIGLIIGFFYDRNILRLQTFRLPEYLERLVGLIHGYIASIFGTTSNRQQRAVGIQRDVLPNDYNNVLNGRNFESFENFNEEMLRFGGFGNRIALEPPSEESIQNLMALGFDRATVLQALAATGNNIEAAANRLIR